MPVEHQDTIGALDYSRIYFSAADSYSFLDQAAFNKNLILSSLFHGDLVVPDIYFLIGNVFPTAFRSESSLAMELLKAGHIQPWFRTQGRGSFEAAFIDIQQSGIFGVREDAREIAEFLDKKLGREKTYKFGVWNGDLGASFNKVVQSFLEQPSPPVATHDVVQLWERTQPWRIDAIGDARARSAQNTLRRGEIIRAVGKQLGFESDDKALYPSELLESLSLGAKRRDLRHFLSWLSQSYYKNQADMFGIDRVYFDTVGFDQVGPYRFAALDIEVAREREEVLTQAILIPSVESLANMNRRELIAIRNGEEAQEYFSTQIGRAHV